MTNPQHSSASNEHYTPLAISNAAYDLMNGIALDPASSFDANTLIQAGRYFEESDDGLHQPWRARSVFLNPPGGCVKQQVDGRWVKATRWDEAKQKYVTGTGKSAQAVWWDKLLSEYRSGSVEQAVFLAFSVELIGKRPDLLDFPVCFTAATATDPCISGQGRIKFLNEQMEPQGQPTHCCLIVYLPPRDMTKHYQMADFARLFTPFGRCVPPVALGGEVKVAA